MKGLIYTEGEGVGLRVRTRNTVNKSSYGVGWVAKREVKVGVVNGFVLDLFPDKLPLPDEKVMQDHQAYVRKGFEV